jgi:hypothetical protein
MPKAPQKKRFEVHLQPPVAQDFTRIAKKENRSIKNLMETVLLEWLDNKKKS